MRRSDPPPRFARIAGAGDNGGPGSRASAPTFRGSDAPRIAARPVPQTTPRARHAMSETPQILYTLTDDAPCLATQSLAPVWQPYSATPGTAVATRDSSLAPRHLPQLPSALRTDARGPSAPAHRGGLTH